MMDRVKERIRMGEECAQMLDGVCQTELDELAKAILHARRIFVAGWGRAGNMIKILSMNCSQAGLRTYVVGDNGTPSIGEEDLLVIGSGSGETKTMVVIAEQAKAHGAKLALVTGKKESTIGKLADLQVFIPGPVRPEGEKSSGWLRRLHLPGVQHGGRHHPVLSGRVYGPGIRGYRL